MGDFLISFRDPNQRDIQPAVAFLQFFPDVTVHRIDEALFSLVLTSVDDPDLWAPAWSQDGRCFAAITGRIALDASDWDAARRLPGSGGLACRHVLDAFQKRGVEAVGQLDGHFVILLFDRSSQRVHILTDRWGLVPCFVLDAGGAPIFASHSDALARVSGDEQDYDLTSLAEFALASKVSAPWTYYRRIRSLPVASVVTIAADSGTPRATPPKQYFTFRYDPQPIGKIHDVAAELAAALRNAATRRSLPLFGRTAVALSGGLDSRTLLCSTASPGQVLTFCCHDAENEEFQLAKRIAKEAGSEFLPLRRSPEFYAENARLGVRISGGLGSLASNHFLGFRDVLRTHNVGSLLTGCYWDYLFKGLGFNKQVDRWTTRESVGSFGFSYYARHATAPTTLAKSVRDRLEGEFPEALRRDRSEPALAEVEHRRLFPLFYEEDSTARSIPLRVLPWYIPIADNAVMAARMKLGSAMKLNRRAMIEVTQEVCGPTICSIADANTGAPVGSGPWREAWSYQTLRIRNRLARLRPSRATSGSWLNWGYYLRHSPQIRSLWNVHDTQADDLFDQILGPGAWPKDPAECSGDRIDLFIRLLTLKTWMTQRGS